MKVRNFFSRARGGVKIANATRDINEWPLNKTDRYVAILVRDHSQLMSERTIFRGWEGLEIFQKRSDISVLVALSTGHFRSRGVKKSQNRNVRRTLVVNDP